MRLHRTAEVLLVAFLSAFGAYLLGSCGKTEARDDARVAYKLANHYRWQRDSTAKAVEAKREIRTEVVKNDPKLLAQLDSLKAALDFAEGVLANPSADTALLRLALRESVRQGRAAEWQSRQQQLRVRAYLAADAIAEDLTNRTFASADSALAASRLALQASHKKRWHYRTQGAFVGGILALLAVIAL